MTATASPFGLRPVYHPSGNDRASAYTIASAYGTSIFKGDPVILNANGTVTVGAAASTLLGVFAGCEYTDSTGKPTYSNYYPASVSILSGTPITAWVYDDPTIVYEIQSAGSVPQTAIGDEGDISTYAAGSTSTGLSIVSLNATLGGAGVQKQFRIIGFSLAPDNAVGDSFTVVQVTLANTQFRAPTTGV